MRLWRLPAAFFVLCSLASAEAFGLSDLHDVRVTKSATDDASAFCNDFRLNAREAKRALRSSHEVTAEAYTHDFEFLPCFVVGTGRIGTEPIDWVLRAGGNGTITKKDRSVVFIGCNSCKRWFGAH